MAFVLPECSLWKRELVRFVRDRHRLYGSILQPLLFWLLVGAGLNASFFPAGVDAQVTYLEYIYPGTLLLILLFTAIFSTISVVEDRREGFMQSVLVAPIPRTSVVLGKVLGGTTLAVLEGLIFLVFAYQLDIHLSPLSLAATLCFLILLGMALTGLGFTIAWRMESTAGFHAIMNLFLLPMWLLSGAFFPLSGAPPWLSWLMQINPLTYGMAGLRRVLYLEEPGKAGDVISMEYCIGVTLIFTLITIFTSVGVMLRGEGGSR